MTYKSFYVSKALKTFEYNILEIYDWSVPGNLSDYFESLLGLVSRFPDNALNIAEFGVHKGRTTLSTALFMRQLGKDSKIFAYDTWEGFPDNSYHSFDGDAGWDYLIKNRCIDKEFLDYRAHVKQLYSLRKRRPLTELDVTNISSSGDFSDTSLVQLKAKANFLGINNITFLKGDFTLQLKNHFYRPPSPLHMVLMDCDLYSGYATVLPIVWAQLSIGGIIYLDEYFSYKFPGPRIATDQFLNTLSTKEYNLERVSFNGDFDRYILEKI
jgi:hypothetical protein